MDKIPINRFSSVPLHTQLTQFLKKQIVDGTLESGDTLPTESEMAKLAGVSIAVVRQAYTYLRRAGLIITKQGKGTFIANPKVTIDIMQSFDSYKEAKRRGVAIKTEVIEFIETKDVGSNIKKKLHLSEESSLLKLTRLRSFDGIKMFFWTSYLPLPLCQPLIKEDFTKNSLFEVIKNKLNVDFSRAERWAQVVRADQFQSAIFDISELDPLFFVESITYTDDNVPIEYYEGWYRTDYGRIYFEIK